MRVGPPPERQPWLPQPDLVAELPRMLDAARPPERPVAAEDDERREPVLPRLFGIAQTEIERMLRREERDDAIARQIAAEIGHQVPQVVLFLGAHGAVGQEYRDILA